ELAAAGRGREVRLEDDRLSRVALVLARIGYGRVALETLPSDALDRVHAAAHLVPHFARMAVGPGKAEALRQLDDDPEVFARIARRLQCGAAELDHAAGVGHRARLLGPRRRRQDDIREIRGLRPDD